MATIGSTLNQIQELQREIDEGGLEDRFVQELMNFTTIVFFQYLAHAVLDEAKDSLSSLSQAAQKYYELSAQPEVLTEFIRFSNSGQFVCIWNAYEKYLRQKYFNDFGLTEFKINQLFDDLVDRIQPSDSAKIKEEFEVMRNTRNSLHDGGVFSEKFTPWSGSFLGATYKFSPGEPVTPLRVVDVCFVMWSHYGALETAPQ